MRALSGTTSHSATIFTLSTPSSSVSTERPRSPVPTMPTRTTSCFANGTARIDFRVGGAGGSRSGCEPAVTCSAIALEKGPAVAMPAVASAAPLSRSRRERSDICSSGADEAGNMGCAGSPRPAALLLMPVAAAAHRHRATIEEPRLMSTSSASAPRAAVGAPAPIDSDERLHSLDVLRGLALAGMILVHFHQRLERPVTGAEDLIGWGVWIFVEQKAWGTFAFLFGVGFAVLLRRLESRGAAVIPIYLRRLAALAVIGIVAQVGLGFSILFEYACWGLVLLLVRKWPTRRLLVLALVAACARPIVAEASALYAWWTTAAASPAGPNLWA